jgi:putative ABC transport system permease protein
MNLIAARLTQAYPDTNQDRGINITPLNQGPGLRADALPVLGLLMSAVGLVLLIACANVANLLLARAVARRKEIAIRLSLGASRGRLIRQLLTESVLLSLLAGAGGLLVALWGAELLYTFDIPRVLRFTLDLRVFAFTLALSVLTGVLFGLVPAFQSSRPDLVTALKDEAGTVTGSRRSSRLRGLFVVAQVALSLVLLIGSGLFLRTLQKAYAVDPGFNTGNVLLASLNLDLHGYSQQEGQAFYGRLTERLQALPEVQSVSMARVVPLSGSNRTSRVTFEGREIPPVDEWPRVFINVVGLDYFRTLGTPLLQGRTFDALHSTSSPPVAVINRTMARRFWPDEDSLGKRFRFGSRGPFLEVIGVVRDAKYLDLRQRPIPTLYLPLQQNYESGVTLFVRTAGNPTAALPAVRRQVRALDADLPLYRIRTFARELQASLSEERLAATLLGSFSLLALALAAVGIYGVISYSVSQRMHEIGIRMALGAQPRDIFKLVVGQGMVLALIGVAVGLAASFALTRFLKSMLFGVSVTDPATFAGMAVLLAGVALLACYLPARRATKVDPLVALRYE